jgi:hypothetical protein
MYDLCPSCFRRRSHRGEAIRSAGCGRIRWFGTRAYRGAAREHENGWAAWQLMKSQPCRKACSKSAVWSSPQLRADWTIADNLIGSVRLAPSISRSAIRYGAWAAATPITLVSNSNTAGDPALAWNCFGVRIHRLMLRANAAAHAKPARNGRQAHRW